ncbi:hypothetical protein [Gottfriedia solisilvae]|uniref:Uncharacterized protein n=1 Tax=Gottfriedia solisilvae TaxID=1516104 RepID=A0A8J3AP65_9BACI|nr:hypothetical protein [Gottfriedia solisilvae]GGI16269.1 hypothetical protein GCM10007380_32120 [Gottfriedia solisilvae]
MFFKDKNTEVESEEEYPPNIFEFLPPIGTILGKATEDEIEKSIKLEAKHYSFMRLMEMNVTINSYKELLDDFYEFEYKSVNFWANIAKRIDVPTEWIIRIDQANGDIYSMQEFPFEQIEEE